MELKLIYKPNLLLPPDRSNRTFMELKSSHAGPSMTKKASSNRTFMELKLIICADWSHGKKVLIVPLWN